MRLKHSIGADQDFYMLYHWYRKNKHDMNMFYKLTRLTVTHLYWTFQDASITHCWHISKNILQKWPFSSVMQSHLIKMYIYHTKHLMFKISSWAKLKGIVLRLLSCKFCCFNYWNRYKITDFMSKIISAKVWLNIAKSSIYLFKYA